LLPAAADQTLLAIATEIVSYHLSLRDPVARAKHPILGNAAKARLEGADLPREVDKIDRTKHLSTARFARHRSVRRRDSGRDNMRTVDVARTMRVLRSEVGAVMMSTQLVDFVHRENEMTCLQPRPSA